MGGGGIDVLWALRGPWGWGLGRAAGAGGAGLMEHTQALPHAWVYTHVHIYTGHTHLHVYPSTYVAHIPTSLLQLRMSAHTHITRILTRRALQNQCTGGHVLMAKQVTCTEARMPPCTRVLGHTCTHTCFSPYTVKCTCASAHTQAAYNSMQMPLSPKCAGTKVKESCKAHWAPHEWVGWGPGLPPSAPHGWTLPPPPPTKGHST